MGESIRARKHRGKALKLCLRASRDVSACENVREGDVFGFGECTRLVHLCDA